MRKPKLVGRNKKGERVFWHRKEGAFGTEKDFTHEATSTLSDVRQALQTKEGERVLAEANEDRV